MRPYTAQIEALLRKNGPLTALELRKLNGVRPDDKRAVNLHAWGLVEARKLYGIDLLADGKRYALPGVPHETTGQRERRRRKATPLPSRVEPVDLATSQVRGLAVGSLKGLHNMIGDAYYDELVEEVIDRFDRSVIVLRDDIKVLWTRLVMEDAFDVAHLLTADQVDLCRRAAERKHEYYEPHEAEIARGRYERLFSTDLDVITWWGSKAAHKAWITRREFALWRRRKLFTHFYRIEYEFAGQGYDDGELCVSEVQAKRAIYRAERRILTSFKGATIVLKQVAPFTKKRVRVRARAG